MGVSGWRIANVMDHVCRTCRLSLTRLVVGMANLVRLAKSSVGGSPVAGLFRR